MRRLIGIVATAAVLGGCSPAVTDDPVACRSQLRVDQATVRTAPPTALPHLPGTGSYVAIHWQAHALGDPCDRAPGPTDWTYQQVIDLPAADAAALLAGYSWSPSTVDVWPDLATYLPAGASWRHSDGYDAALGGDDHVYLDPERHAAVVVSAPH